MKVCQVAIDDGEASLTAVMRETGVRDRHKETIRGHDSEDSSLDC